jgi:hypothetical protein
MSAQGVTQLRLGTTTANTIREPLINTLDRDHCRIARH